MIKYSRQREAILNNLMKRTDHPTAEMLYQDIRTEYPKISLGTVYRNLILLEEMGEIQKISCGDAAERYDGNAANHYHFICKKCHQVYDVPMKGYISPSAFLGDGFMGQVDDYQLVLRGTCPDCCREILLKK